MSTAEVQAEIGRALAPDPALQPAIPPNRRFWTLDNVEVGKALVPEPVFRTIEDACEKALSLWPNAKAAILFGSRARGDHSDHSDWDIAFITDTEKPLPDSVVYLFNELQERAEIEVQAKAISRVRFNEGADSLGNLAAPIAREGRLIAGRCEWPKTEGEPILKPNVYKQWRNGALKRAALASERLAEAIEYAHVGTDPGEFGLFVANSSDAAEFCAKIAFGKLTSGTGAEIPRRHQVDKIVMVLDRGLEQNARPNAEWWRSDSGKKLRDLLLKMNGHWQCRPSSRIP